MNKIASDIMDYIEDGRFNELSETCKNLPEDFLKTAHIPTKTEVDSTPNSHFGAIILSAGQIDKKYQCDTPELTKLNSLLLIRDQNVLPDEVLKTAAYHLGIACTKFKLPEAKELSKLAGSKCEHNVVESKSVNKTQHMHKLEKKKEAEKTEKEKVGTWALPDIQKYPLNNKEDVQSALNYFDTYSDQFKQAEKFVFAVNTAAAARKFETNYENHKIAKYASLNIFDMNPDAKHHIRIRKQLATPEYEDAYTELESKLGEFVENPMGLSEILTKVDVETGVARLWGSTIEEPILTAMNTIKTASIKVDGHAVTLTDLQKIQNNPKCAEYLDRETIRDLGGPEGLEIFASLPMPVRDDLYKLI